MGYSFISAYANLPKSSCHFWKHKSVFLQILHQSTMYNTICINLQFCINLQYYICCLILLKTGSFEGGPKLPLDETRYEEVLIKKVFYLTQRKYQENQGSIKVGLSPSIKNCSYLLQWKPFKNDEKCFLFHLKSFFCSQDI